MFWIVFKKKNKKKKPLWFLWTEWILLFLPQTVWFVNPLFSLFSYFSKLVGKLCALYCNILIIKCGYCKSSLQWSFLRDRKFVPVGGRAQWLPLKVIPECWRNSGYLFSYQYLHLYYFIYPDCKNTLHRYKAQVFLLLQYCQLRLILYM